MALSSETKADEIEGGKVVQLNPKGAEKAKAEKPDEEEKPKAIDFDNLGDATKKLVKALDTADREIANRKEVGASHRDTIKSLEEKLAAEIDGARASNLKDAGLEIAKTKERSATARTKAKEARAAFAELAEADDGAIGKAWRKLEKAKAERAADKAAAAAKVKKARARVELLRYSIHEAAGQLRLDL